MNLSCLLCQSSVFCHCSPSPCQPQSIATHYESSGHWGLAAAWPTIRLVVVVVTPSPTARTGNHRGGRGLVLGQSSSRTEPRAKGEPRNIICAWLTETSGFITFSLYSDSRLPDLSSASDQVIHLNNKQGQPFSSLSSAPFSSSSSSSLLFLFLFSFVCTAEHFHLRSVFHPCIAYLYSRLNSPAHREWAVTQASLHPFSRPPLACSLCTIPALWKSHGPSGYTQARTRSTKHHGQNGHQRLFSGTRC